MNRNAKIFHIWPYMKPTPTRHKKRSNISKTRKASTSVYLQSCIQIQFHESIFVFLHITQKEPPVLISVLKMFLKR